MNPQPSVLVLGARGRFGQAAARAFAALIGAEPHTPFPQALRPALAERGMLGAGAAMQPICALASR